MTETKGIPQPVVRGKVTTVDGTASGTKKKLIVWVDRECPIWVEDEVEIRTLRRMMLHSWEPSFPDDVR